jgi:sporulation protein YlmC with PRC-barrel domain
MDFLEPNSTNKHFYHKSPCLFSVKILIKPEKIIGKKVMTYRGMLMGEVDSIEVNEQNWSITEVDVALTKEMEKIFDIKTHAMSKAVVPLPITMMGPIEEDSIKLKEEIKDPQALLNQATTERSKILHR